MKRKPISDADLIAAIAQKELDDLAKIDGAESGGHHSKN